MKALTEKEKSVLSLVAGGTSKIDAVQQVYNCKNRNIAKVQSSRLFKRENVNSALTNINKKQLDKIKAKLLPEWEKILNAPMKKGGISYDSKIKGLSYLSEKTIFNKDKEQKGLYQFGGKFIKVEKINQYFKSNAPETAEATEKTAEDIELINSGY